MLIKRFERYDDCFIATASEAEIRAAIHDVAEECRKSRRGTPEYAELTDLWGKLANRTLTFGTNPDPNYRWTDKSRWDD